MGTIYSGVKGYNKPDIMDFGNYNKNCKKYVEDIKACAKKNGTGKFAGKEIHFPVADGYASYIILSLKPVELIHLDIYDGWIFEYAHRLTAKDIKEKVEYHEGMKKLFKQKGGK